MTDVTTVAEAEEPRRRLHPLSPLLRGFRFALLAVAAISWQGYQNLGPRLWTAAVVGVAVLVLVGSLVSWLVTGFHVVGRELRIYEGLLFRRTRAIPVERLQSVELVQPVLARIFGLAELRLEVVGGSRTEAPLAYLTRDQATALRRRLLDLAAVAKSPASPIARAQAAPDAAAAAATAASAGEAGGVDASPTVMTGIDTAAVATGEAVPSVPSAPVASMTPAAPVASVTPVEQPIHRVNNRDLFISQLLRPQWWLLPLAVAVPIVDTVWNGRVGFFAVASTATAVFGAISAPVRVLLGDWHFTLASGADGLRIRRGLLETRSSTVPEGRIQSVLVEWPLLWRPSRWVRANMHVAGVRAEGQQQSRAGLLPVGTVEVAEYVVGRALPGVTLREISIRGVPDRAKWFAPLRRRVIGYHLGPAAFAAQDGLLTRRLVIVPYGRIQSVRVRQGPLQRRLRLATVIVDVAGGGQPGVAPHLDVAEARTLALALAEHSRLARTMA